MTRAPAPPVGVLVWTFPGGLDGFRDALGALAGDTRSCWVQAGETANTLACFDNTAVPVAGAPLSHEELVEALGPALPPFPLRYALYVQAAILGARGRSPPAVEALIEELAPPRRLPRPVLVDRDREAGREQDAGP